jgi:integron integrase
MLAVPEHISCAFQAALSATSVPVQQQGHFKKWLRYYLDFCDKYQFPPEQCSSLPAFIDKLKHKHQTKAQCEQAKQAITVYYQLSTAPQGKQIEGASPVLPETPPEHPMAPKTTKHHSNKRKPTLPVEYIVPITTNANDSEPVLPDYHGKSSLQIAEPESPYQPDYAQQGANWVHLYEGLKNEIRLRHYSPKTLSTYQGWLRKFQAFVKSKDTRLLSQQDVKDYLTHLAVNKKVAASTQNQAFNALLFLYKQVIKTDFGEIKGVPRAKRQPYVPVVLSQVEINQVIDCLSPLYVLPVQLLYGCGLRISECLNLRLQDFNLDVGRVTVHRGKGKKDRTLPLPQSIMACIQSQFERVADLYNEDLSMGYAGVFLPDNIDNKYKNAARELSWQWFFPAKTLTFVDNENAYRRYHLHDSHLQKAIKRAVKKAKLTKRVSAHTFRHSFASHLVQAHYDIRTVQELMGHSDVKTTMIYLQTVPSLTLKEAKSPLDFEI